MNALPALESAMNCNTTARTLLAAAAATLAGFAPATLAQQQNLISYQGQLADGGSPANGLYDMHFRVYDLATGGTIQSNACLDNVPVVNGLFTVQVDLGPFNQSAARWMQIEVRPDPGSMCGIGSGYTILSPRQRLTAVPWATHAGRAFGLSNPSNGAVAAHVDAGGRVGVGTTVPLTPLHVLAPSARTRLDSSSSTDFTVLELNTTGQDYHVGVGGPSSVGGLANSFYVYDNSVGATRFAINPAGQVGIGTNTPAAALDVRSGTGSYVRVDSANGDLHVNGGGDGVFGLINQSGVAGGRTEIHTVGGRSLSIDNATGNIGLSTLPTGNKLQVNGNIGIPRTVRTKTIHGSAFMPQYLNNPSFGTQGGLTVIDSFGTSNSGTFGSPGSSGPGIFFAPLDLPDGCVLEDIIIDARDQNTSHNPTLTIGRINLGSGLVEEVATTFTSGSSSVIQHAAHGPIGVTVVNDTHCYFLRCVMTTTGGTEWLIAARVKYSVTSPLP
jgi:hypothetical protein